MQLKIAVLGETLCTQCAQNHSMYTPTWTYLELSQMDVGQFFDLLRFENRGKLEELSIISK